VLVVPLGASTILVASLLPPAHEPLLPLLQSPWLMVHISVFFAAYAAFTIAFAAALAYLLQERALRHRQVAWRLPPLLVVMDRLSRWSATVGLLLMLAAILTGSAWAERAFLARLGGGCHAPVAAYAKVDGRRIRLQALVAIPDGKVVLRGEAEGTISEPELLGWALAEDLLTRGADRLV